MTEQVNAPTNLIVKLSDYFRRNYNKIEANPLIKKKSVSTLSYLTYSTLPIILSSTILYPLHRVKVLLQTNSLRVNKFNSLSDAINQVKSKGFLSFWKGVRTLNFLIFCQGMSKFIFHERIKDYLLSLSNKKNYVLIKATEALSALLSGLVTALITYPYDLTNARNSASMIPKYDASSSSNYIKGLNKIQAKFHGVEYALLEGSINGFCILFLYHTLRSFTSSSGLFTDLFGLSALIGVISSTLTYPINTFRRQIQVCGSNSEFVETSPKLSNIFSSLKTYYR